MLAIFGRPPICLLNILTLTIAKTLPSRYFYIPLTDEKSEINTFSQLRRCHTRIQLVLLALGATEGRGSWSIKEHLYLPAELGAQVRAEAQGLMFTKRCGLMSLCSQVSTQPDGKLTCLEDLQEKCHHYVAYVFLTCVNTDFSF